MYRFEVTILGCSSATPMFNRHPTSQWVTYNNTHFLFDCGEGTQMQMMRYGLKASKLHHIFISHLHGDHYLGIIGLLSSMNLNGRTDPLHLYAPPALEDLLYHHFRISETVLKYPLQIHETFPESPEYDNESRALLETPEFIISTIPLLHSIPCRGFLVTEKNGPRKLKKDRLQSLNIPNIAFDNLKKGLDYIAPDGEILRAEGLTETPFPIRKYAFCSDTCYLPRLGPQLQGVSTLYHETTFGHDFRERAELTYHTTVTQAANFAKEIGAGKLIMGHFSARYRDLNPLLEEATAIFPNSFLGLEGNTFQV